MYVYVHVHVYVSDIVIVKITCFKEIEIVIKPKVIVIVQYLTNLSTCNSNINYTCI